MIQRLTAQGIIDKLATYKGLIPSAIITDGKEILWQDIESYHFYEGFFHKSLNTFTALKGQNIAQFITDVSVLKNQIPVSNSLYPTAFIFHAGRCGSTNLAKVLARSRQNLVISESGPLNRILQSLTLPGKSAPEQSSENLSMYRNLVLALGRQRVKTHKRYFIKFTSFNILFFDFIHAAFPDVPCIFLTRPVDEILNSWQKKLPGWLGTQAPWMMDLLSEITGAGLKEIVEGFLRVAAEKNSSVLKHIDYRTLTAEGLPQTLAHINVFPDNDEMEQMASQFRFDSKAEFNKKLFEK
jgi:hypothetical protein